jgi:hypothetical protein
MNSDEEATLETAVGQAASLSRVGYGWNRTDWQPVLRFNDERGSQ